MRFSCTSPLSDWPRPRQARQQVLGDGGGRRQQAGAGGGHQRRQGGGDDQAADAVRQAVLDHAGEGVVDVLQVRQQDLGGHPDQRPGHAVEHAVDTGGGAGDLGHGLAAGGEHPLPDVLADEDAEEVDQEVGDDGVPADRGEVEVAGRQLGHQGVPAAGVVDRQRHQQEHQADGHDQELHDVGQGQRPHAADGGVKHHDAATDQDRDRTAGRTGPA